MERGPRGDESSTEGLTGLADWEECAVQCRPDTDQGDAGCGPEGTCGATGVSYNRSWRWSHREAICPGGLRKIIRRALRYTHVFLCIIKVK